MEINVIVHVTTVTMVLILLHTLILQDGWISDGMLKQLVKFKLAYKVFCGIYVINCIHANVWYCMGGNKDE